MTRFLDEVRSSDFKLFLVIGIITFPRERNFFPMGYKKSFVFSKLILFSINTFFS
jgi:hypothetical protein